MHNLFEIRRAFDDLTAHFHSICECFEEEKSELDGLTVITDKTSLITVSGMGIKIRIEPILSINKNKHLQPQLSIAKEAFYDAEKLDTLARFNLSDRSVASINVEGDEYTFDFGLLKGYPLRKPPIVHDFLSLVITLALQQS